MKNKIYVPRHKKNKISDIIEKIFLVAVLTAFGMTIIIGSSMVIILLSEVVK